MADITEPHPLEAFRASRGWPQREAAEFFDIALGFYKKIVRGFRGVSTERAVKIEKLSNYEIPAIDVLKWHSNNRR